MSPSSHPHRSVLAMPDWLDSHAGRAALGLAAAMVVAKVATATGHLPSPPAGAVLAAITLAAITVAFVQVHRLARERTPAVDLRPTWRMFRLALLTFGACALAAGLADHVEPRLRTPLLLGAGLGSLPGLGIVLLGTVRMPGGEIAPRHRITAALDIATLMLAGLVGFWIFALSPAMHALHDGAPLWPVVVIAFYAFFSLLLISLLLLLPFRSHEPGVARGLGFVAVGCLALVAVEVVPYCHGIVDTRAATRPAFLGWALFAFAAALHARRMRDEKPAPETAEPVQPRFAMPWASLGLVVVLLFASLVTRDLWRANMPLLLPSVFAAFVLVVVRQTVIARENYTMVLEMQRAKEIAESANSARLQFLANISHDLRTPLNGVLGCAQILLREKTVSSKQRELLKTIQGCGEHLRNLINDLLDLSKLEADRLELAPSPFDLKAFLKALIKTFELEAETKKIVLELDEASDLPAWIQCDRKRLQQILGNLVHNAIKFTDTGRVKVRARIASGALIFEVIDTGCGILPDKIGELFQPFHVVDERSIKLEGTGLGLSICKKLANKMGGDISVSSRLGKGSTFTVVIPFVPAAPVVEVERTVVDYQGRRRRVLIVDDNAANRAVLRAMLEPLDFLIQEADGAVAAREQIGLAQPDIVLMDLMMPGTDGFTLCREILEMDILRMPVLLAVSAMAGEDVLERCRKAGFADLLHKPVHLHAVVNALRAHAGVEWTYGVIQPAPARLDEASPTAPIVPPPPEEVSAFLDLARRGVVRNIETRAEQLAHAHPEFTPFARRVARYARDFKLKELGEWLTSLLPQNAHGPA